MASKLSLRQRAGLALGMLTGRLGSELVSSSKAAPMLFPSWVNGQPQWHMVDYRSYVEEGFNLNTIVYESVMYKAKSITLAPLRAYTGDREHPTLLGTNHPLTMLLERPNEFQSQMEFMSLCMVYLNITGNAFIVLDREGKIGSMPIGLYTVRPDRMFIIPDKNKIKGYVYVPEGKSWMDGTSILPSDVIHVKFPNPGDPLDGMGYGLSPMSAIARSGDVDNSISRFLKLFFDRGMMLGGVIKTDQVLNDETLARIKERWKQTYGGSTKWATEVGVFDSGTSYEQTTPPFDQMGFGVIDERNETRIAGPFGVPPILIGSRIGLMRSTYANYAEARRACWEDTLTYEINLFEVDFNYYLGGIANGTFVAADTSKVPALQKNVPELILAARGLIDVGVPPNEAFAKVGLDIKHPHGDISFMATGFTPTERVINPPEPPPMLGAGGNNPDDEQYNPKNDLEGEQAQSAAKKHVRQYNRLRP